MWIEKRKTLRGVDYQWMVPKKGKDYFLISPKDGNIYKVKRHSFDPYDESYSFRLIEKVDNGLYAFKQREGLQSIVHFKKTDDTYTRYYKSLEEAIIYYAMETQKSIDALDLDKAIKVYLKVYRVLDRRPDIHLKVSDKLMKSKIFRGMLDEKFNYKVV